MEGAGAIFGDAIAYSHALVLAPMFRPGFDNKSLDVATWVGWVAVESRAERTVAETLLPHGLHCKDESARLLRVDAVLDHHQYRSVLRMGFNR